MILFQILQGIRPCPVLKRKNMGRENCGLDILDAQKFRDHAADRGGRTGD